MKLRSNHLIILIGLVVFAIVVAIVLREQSAGESETGSAASAISRHPTISLETDRLDTGPISNTETSHFDIRVSNTGQMPLQIHRIQGSCPACLSGEIDNPEIAPGHSSTLTIRIDPFHVYGFESSKSISINSNDPNRSVVVLPVSIEVEPEFIMEPDNLAFGDVQKGQVVEKTMILRQVGEQPFQILDIHTQGPSPSGIDFDYGLRPENEWEDDEIPEHYITARLLPEIPLGQFGYMLRIATDIERLSFGMPVSITANVVSFYTVEPEKILQLGTVHRGDRKVGTVAIAGHQPIEVVEAALTTDDLVAHIRSTDDPEVWYIDVDVRDGDREGRLRGQLSFAVTDGESVVDHTLEVFGLAQAP